MGDTALQRESVRINLRAVSKAKVLSVEMLVEPEKGERDDEFGTYLGEFVLVRAYGTVTTP